MRCFRNLKQNFKLLQLCYDLFLLFSYKTPIDNVSNSSKVAKNFCN